MGRKYDIVDVVAAVGLAATLFGGYLLVTAADGFWQRPPAPTVISASASDTAIGMQWLQPALGRALVDDFLLDRDAGAAVSAAAAELNRAIDEYQRMTSSLLGPLALAELSAMGQEADHRARMQFVMGKQLVNGTARGIRSGTLAADQYVNDFNTAMISQVERIGQRMHDQFEQGRQPFLGQMILDAIQEEDRLEGAMQERLGWAVTRMAMAQSAYGEAKADRQQQLASAAIAAVRTEALMERLERVAMLEAGPPERMPAAVHSRAAPDIDYAYLSLACVGLILLFVGALSLATRRREEDMIPVWKVETLLRLHRSTS